MMGGFSSYFVPRPADSTAALIGEHVQHQQRRQSLQPGQPGQGRRGQEEEEEELGRWPGDIPPPPTPVFRTEPTFRRHLADMLCSSCVQSSHLFS